MTGEERAALLLKSLPSEMAEAVLAQLGPQRSSGVRARMQVLEQQPEPDEALDEVLSDLEALLRIASDEASGRASAASQPAAANEAKPDKLEKEESGSETAGDQLSVLRRMDLDLLAAALKGENSRTVCLLLNNMDAIRAGEILKRLSPELRREVTLQMGQAMACSPQLVERIAQAVVQKSYSLRQAPAEESVDAKIKKMADMLRLLEKSDRMELLAAIAEQDAEKADKIKEYLYQFEDLLAIADRSMQKLLSQIDSKNLAMALKGSSDAIREKVMNNLSKRARESLEEEMEFLASVSANQIKEAQKTVVDVIQRLDQAGELVMSE